MVHALREARRVVRPGGLIIDLRPAVQHRRVAVVRAGQAQPVGALRENFDDDHAANRAVAKMVRRQGESPGTRPGGRGGVTPPLQFVGRTKVDCQRVMDGPDDFREWLASFATRGDKLPPHDWLVERLERALAQQPGTAKVVVVGPLDLRVLRKPARKA